MIGAAQIRRSPGRGLQSSRETSVPAPWRGIDAKSPLTAMPLENAVVLTNWWPLPSSLVTRPGAKTWVSGVSGPVKSLFVYNPLGEGQRLFGATDGRIYDFSTYGSAVQVGECSFGEFISTNINVQGTPYLYIVNGVDKPRLYNGAEWKEIDATSTPTLAGFPSATAAAVHTHHRRLWFIPHGSMSAWYLPVNQLGGTATEFPLGSLFRLGGELVAMGSWTIDAGDGSDDYAVFVTSRGEVAVYKGTNPDSSADWALNGVYFVGEPLGHKCLVKYGGDVLLLTQGAITPMSNLLLTASINRSASALSDLITPLFASAAQEYRDYYGWQPLVYPEANLLLVNVPAALPTQGLQFVMNTVTGAWSQFSGWNAYCWASFQDDIFFGMNGGVAQAWTGCNDFGAAIDAEAMGAFSHYGAPGRRKHIKMIQPRLRAIGGTTFQLGVSTDFEAGLLSTTMDIPDLGEMSRWDFSAWDGSAAWDVAMTPYQRWHGVGNRTGFYKSILLRALSLNSPVEWLATDLIFAVGGPL